MNLSPWAKILIAAAWQGLKVVLIAVGVPTIVVGAVETLLQHLGLLGSAELSLDEMESRARKVCGACQ